MLYVGFVTGFTTVLKILIGPYQTCSYWKSARPTSQCTLYNYHVHIVNKYLENIENVPN